jgi:6-phosphogluconolactonase
MRFIALSAALLFSLSGFAQHYYLFIGTYTTGKSEGIYVYDFNAATGIADSVSVTKSANSSYLAIAPGGKYVYAVNEGGNPGHVSAFSFNKKTGHLQFINDQESGGADPCFIAVDNSRKWAVVANYSGGCLSALPININGSIEPVAQLIQHYGKGTDTVRQEKAHVHSTFFTPDERYIFSADLGMDQLMIYKFNKNAAQPLSDAKDSIVHILPGSGPRHLAFHPTKPYVYLIEELTGTIDGFHYSNGVLTHKQRISSEPADFTGSSGSADIHITPNGKFLYATNRGDANNIAIYSIDSITGKLHVKGFQSVLGKHPRNFIIDPSGHFLLVANRDTDNVVVFKINPVTGLLKSIHKEISIPNPVCLKLSKK